MYKIPSVVLMCEECIHKFIDVYEILRRSFMYRIHWGFWGDLQCTWDFQGSSMYMYGIPSAIILFRRSSMYIIPLVVIHKILYLWNTSRRYSLRKSLMHITPSGGRLSIWDLQIVFYTYKSFEILLCMWDYQGILYV